jgi:integrase
MRVSGGQPRSCHDQCRPCDDTHVLEYADATRVRDAPIAVQGKGLAFPLSASYIWDTRDVAALDSNSWRFESLSMDAGEGPQRAACRVQAFLNAKAATSLAPRTVAYIRAVLRQALGQAERWAMVSRNVARIVEPPRVPRREVRSFSPDQARQFVDAIRGDRLEALYLVALGTGLRQGEILGLAWTDVDLVAATLTVRNALQRVNGKLELVEPKSATSHRIVALPAFVAEGLRAHRTRQLTDRLLAGSHWHEDPRGLVFTTTVGTPMDGIAVTRRFQARLLSAGLPRQRFHDLRNACASLMLAQGVAPRVVMETLGHSQISLTLNTYSHVIPALGRAAAEQMDAMLGPRSAETAAR